VKDLYCLNDLHLGAVRSAGTTPVSALQLREDLQKGFAKLLDQVGNSDLLINGDLFDTSNVSLRDLFTAFSSLRAWLANSQDSTLILPPGNHDLSKNSAVFTSFDMLASLLQSEFGSRVIVPREGQPLLTGQYVIPHMANQDLFDLELKKFFEHAQHLDIIYDYLFLHCNYDNKFAVESDHSLNLSHDVALTLPVRHIVLGHEHQQRWGLGSKVVVVGNQMPSSVADCLSNDTKVMLRICDEGFQQIPVWQAAGDFARLDWRSLGSYSDKARFIRVEGEAAASEASEVIATIAKFRQRSNALVITNGVAVEGAQDQAQMTVSLEQIKSFSVLDALLATLNKDERAKVEALLKEENHV
jgi:hypothetical protein